MAHSKEAKLNKAVGAAEILKSQMADIFADDHDLLQDTLEGETDLFEMVDQALWQMANDKQLIEGIKIILGEASQRKSRIEKRYSLLLAAVLNACQVAETKKIERPLATVSVSATKRKLVISDETLIPDNYWQPQDPKLDKKSLDLDVRDAEKNGRVIPGAGLDNGGEQVNIRFK